MMVRGSALSFFGAAGFAPCPPMIVGPEAAGELPMVGPLTLGTAMSLGRGAPICVRGFSLSAEDTCVDAAGWGAAAGAAPLPAATELLQSGQLLP